MVLSGPVRYDLVLPGIFCYCPIWFSVVWYGMVWYGMVWYGMVCYVWYALVCFGMLSCGLVWYGFTTVLGQEEVWYDRRGSFMPDSVSLVRLELGKFSPAESRSIS